MRQKNQRVGIFIDVQNLYYSARHLYDAKVNFNAILKAGVENRQLIRAFAYVIKTEEHTEKSFFTALEKMGFEIKSKDLQIFHGGAKKGDWDVGIAMDILKMADKLDVIILVSGDGDFKELLETAAAKGCRTEVMAFGRSASSRLKETADEFFDLDKQSAKYLIKGKSENKGKPYGSTPKAKTSR